MKIIISLGSNQLHIEPETDFEKEYLEKYFEHEKDETLETHFTGNQIVIKMCGRITRERK